jgi:lipid-A-disaccharide synthase
MMPKSNRKCVMIIAGEASGDRHGAKLVRAMRSGGDDLFFCGIGGPAMEAAGVRIVADAAQLAVVGITEVLAKASFLIDGIRRAKNTINTLRPDLLILIDFPDFNLHVAAGAKKIGIPVLYYICPQVWAWRPGRVKKIKKRVDHLAVILPFEADFFRKHDIPVTFVGHPLLDMEDPPGKPESAVADSDSRAIGLLPGSRDKEIHRLLPVMLKAAVDLSRRDERLKFLVSVAPSTDSSIVRQLVDLHADGVPVELVEGGVDRIFRRSMLVVAASGTVTLEAALRGIPTVIVYKVSPLTFWLAKVLARVEFIGLVNLIAGRQIVPELIQRRASAKNISKSVWQLLSDDSRRMAIQQELLKVREELGGPGASERAAQIALQMMAGSGP